MCQILIFLEVTNVNVENSTNLVSRKYALAHFINEDIFGDVPKTALYGTTYSNFRIDDNCDLIQGWAKKTNMISIYQVPPNSKNLQATIGIAPVSNFLSPIIGVPDDGNRTPYSYLFLPLWNKWPDLFVRKMKELIEKQRNKTNGNEIKRQWYQFEKCVKHEVIYV